MSRHTDTPKELGEMEVKEAIKNSLNNCPFASNVAYSYYALKASYNYLEFADNDTFAGVCLLIENAVVRYRATQEFNSYELAVKIANELISCNYITEQTLEELGQKQLNEAY